MLLTRPDVKLYLRPFMGEQAGLYEVVNLGTGHVLRDARFRIVQAFWLDDVLEEVAFVT